MAKPILALDQGTTSSRALVVSPAHEILAVAQQEFTQYFPQPGRVEHDPEEIWTTQSTTIEKVLAETHLSPEDLGGIGITNQRETTIVWERDSGRPIHPAIVWQDRRTADLCASLRAEGHNESVATATGLVLDPYFSGTKIAWILDQVDGARARAEAGELCFGTIDSWLLWKLTDGRVHAMDASNASRSLLLNLKTVDWDPTLLELFRVPAAMLPEVRPSSGHFGDASWGPVRGVPICGVAGDQQAALFGQACYESGQAKNTYGTGCFLLMNTGGEIIASKNRLLTTIAWQIGDQVEYALEGSVFIGGAVVQWLRDGLGLIRSADEIEALAKSVEDSGGVFLVPAFAGLGAPHWNPEVRGTITGITRGTTAGHFARAALESIAFQSADLVDCMRRDAGLELDHLRVDGGACVNDGLMQFQANCLQARVIRPVVTESTAMGAAYLAGLAAGTWKSQEEIRAQAKIDRVFEPESAEAVQAMRQGWDRAVRAALEAAHT